MKLNIVILGLSITSSWGNGHATTYRSLVRALAERGHQIVFLERDLPWYADNRDCKKCRYCRVGLYRDFAELQSKYERYVRDADLVIVGSYVPEGIAIGEWAVKKARGIPAFYDIDTPVTLAKIERDECDYISRDLIPEYQLYLSFTGGPTLDVLEGTYGSPMARALYCSVDPQLYFSEKRKTKWALGYLGTYSEDRQPLLEELMLGPAVLAPEQKFIVAGAQYPKKNAVAAQRGTCDASGTESSPHFLQSPTVHAQHHARGHEKGRLLAERSFVRSCCLRHAHHQR